MVPLRARALSRCIGPASRRHASFLTTKPGDRPLEVFAAAVRSGKLREDPNQVAALLHLDALHVQLAEYVPPPPPPPPHRPNASGQSTGGGAAFTGAANGTKAAEQGLWSSLSSSMSDMFGSGGGGGGAGGGGGESAASVTAREDAELAAVSVPRGLYMYGGVGCGKSLLMDTFFDCSTVPEDRKRRVHFHEFMQELHQKMHRLQQEQPEHGDPLPYIAHDISSSTQLLCFDEFQVTDVADALLMRRLFHKLFVAGLVMVATSNRPPQQLYLNGIQRASFVPFIGDLEARCVCHDLDSATDYRILAQVSQGARVYATPLNESTTAHIDQLFTDLASPSGRGVSSQTLRIGGREIPVPSAGRSTAVARFSFTELCGRPLGAADYLGIAAAFHTVFITDIPRFTLNDINQVRRFITLVDALYDKNVKLVASAAASPEDLFELDADSDAKIHVGDRTGAAAHVSSGGGSKDEVFSFGRTISRLREMQSHEYLIRAYLDQAQRTGEVSAAESLELYESSDVMSEQEAMQLFKAYDVDASGQLELPEVELLLGDLCERRTGHRHVAAEVVTEALRHMDGEDTGGVSQCAFLAYIAGSKRASLKLLSMQERAAQENVSYGAEGEAASDAAEDPNGRRRNKISRAAAPPE